MVNFEPTRWQTASALLEQVLQLPVQQQAEAVDRLGTHSGVQTELRKLLDGVRRDSCLDESLDSVFTLMPAVLTNRFSLKGENFDGWILGDEIGRGGMSVVYQATRAGQGFEQQAAFKILSIAFLSQQHIESFLRERKILSELTHPGIARLIDGGISDDGVPYLVMEKISGMPIHNWCQTQASDETAIVRLIVQLCSAVAHAHRHLVVHRDINPGNILVDQRSRPILIDFGIAKLLHEVETGMTLQAFTPEYAAPEQLRGESVTTATDVFGLGKTLDRLLSKKNGNSHNIDRDLLSIIHVATHADIDRRYATARGMGSDLQAWLEGRPVTAHADSWAYRSRKYTSRNWRWLSIAAIALLVALAGFVTTNRQADITRQEAAKHRAVADFMLGMFKQADLMRSGSDLRVTELLETAGERAKTELANQPDALVSLLTLIASGQIELTNYQSAAGMLEAAATLIASTDISAAVRSEYFFERGKEAYELGRYSEAVAQIQKSLDLLSVDASPNDHYFLTAATLVSFLIDSEKYQRARILAERLIDEAIQHPTTDEALTTITHRYAVALEVAGDIELAFTQYREALRLQSEYQPENQLGRAEIFSDYGIALYFADRFVESEAVNREVLQIYEQQFDSPHPRIASITHNLAFALAGQEKLAEAIELQNRSYMMTVELHGTDHIDSLLEQATLGNLITRNKEFARAEIIFRQNIRALDRVAPELRMQRGVIHSYLGGLLLQTNRLEEARAEYLVTLQLLDNLPSDNFRVIEAQQRLTEIATKMSQNRQPTPGQNE